MEIIFKEKNNKKTCVAKDGITECKHENTTECYTCGVYAGRSSVIKFTDK